MSDQGYKRGGSLNPFATYDSQFQSLPDKPYQVTGANAVSGPKDQKRQAEISAQMPQAVSLPPNLFIPEDSQSVDIRNLANVPPNTTVELLRFTGLQGSITKFIKYGIFFDALLFDLVNLIPTVNGKRVYPFHGNPQENYKIGLGTGNDLSEGNMIPGQLELQPRDTLIWTFTNNDVVDVVCGVRMQGYLDQSTRRKTGRWGG